MKTAIQARLPKGRVFAKFLEHRLAVASSLLLVMMGLMALGAPWVCHLLGVSPTEQNVTQRYLPPGSEVSLSVSEQEARLEQKSAQDPAWVSALSLAAKKNGLVSEEEPNDEVPFLLRENLENEAFASQLKSASEPVLKEFPQIVARFRAKHWLGTDELGRDVLARLIYGARVSLFVALTTGLVAAVIGLLIGGLAGFYGGFIDAALMRVTDALLALPVTPLLIILAAVELKSIPGLGWLYGAMGPEGESIAKMVVILACFAWMPMARLVRSSVLSLRESEFVLAARTIGASDARILVSHILPNILAPLVVSVTLATGENMLAESALSFLGLGIQPPVPSWGNMLQNAMELVNSAPLLAVLPGAAIFVVVIAVNFLGDGLRDSWDPRALARAH